MKRTLLFVFLMLNLSATVSGGPVSYGEVQTGKLFLDFNTALLERMGITVAIPDSLGSAATKVHGGTLKVLDASSSDLRFAVRDAGFRYLVSGELKTDTGLALSFGDDVIRSEHLYVRAMPGSLSFRIHTDDNFPLFELHNSHAWLDPGTGDLSFRHMDLRITVELAERLGYPRFADITVGEAHMETTADVPPAALADKGASCGVLDTDGDVDVQLTGMNSTSEIAREPGVRVAMAPDASLKNVGTADVAWFRAINPDGGPTPPFAQHPFLAYNLFRIADGVIEQIGRSQVKHAFFTVNVGSDCDCPGGQILHLGCQDVYGISSNGDRHYLASRQEVTASSGKWDSYGSHFDTYPNEPKDDFRDHGRSDHSDPFEHRMAVLEDDLLVEGASYFVEAWYLIKGDVNILNNMGFRQLDPELGGGAWSFTPFLTSFVNGPAIDAWVDPNATGNVARNTYVVTGDGHLKLAVRTTNLGGGLHRYEYALMNLDYDRQIRKFKVPAPPGVSVTNITFGDLDDEQSNDWTRARGSNAVVWTTKSPKSDSLDWGTLFNFGFTANVGPAETQATLMPLEPPSGIKDSSETLQATTLAPADLNKAARRTFDN